MVTDMCKYESSQNYESIAQTADSTKLAANLELMIGLQTCSVSYMRLLYEIFVFATMLELDFWKLYFA